VRLLLDTHVFLWEVEGDPRLPTRVRDVIEDPIHRVVLSVASVWEAGTKERLGRLQLSRPLSVLVPDALERFDMTVLDVELRHAFRLAELPALQGDPFDRMLVAQAMEEGMTLVTRDRALHAYPIDLLW
jgi:PIN domain nuclease of toxin-antitoxin system